MVLQWKRCGRVGRRRDSRFHRIARERRSSYRHCTPKTDETRILNTKMRLLTLHTRSGRQPGTPWGGCPTRPDRPGFFRRGFGLFAAALAIATLVFAPPAVAQDPGTAGEQRPTSFEVEVPRVVLTGVPFQVVAIPRAESGEALPGYRGTPRLDGAGQAGSTTRRDDGAVVFSDVQVDDSGRFELSAEDGAARGTAGTRAIAGIWSLAPPVVAIVLAILFRQVVLALVRRDLDRQHPAAQLQPIGGLLRGGQPLCHRRGDRQRPRPHHHLQHDVRRARRDPLEERRGSGIRPAHYPLRPKTARRGQVSAMLMALVVFFDDYANVIIRGNLMRPITDGLRVSLARKLAFPDGYGGRLGSQHGDRLHLGGVRGGAD